jgi:hypothetical protein
MKPVISCISSDCSLTHNDRIPRQNAGRGTAFSIATQQGLRC